jgi:hypothetical protein
LESNCPVRASNCPVRASNCPVGMLNNVDSRSVYINKYGIGK